MRHGKKQGWHPFWAAFGAAVLVLLPLVGGTVLFTRQNLRRQWQTAEPQSGIAVHLPKAAHQLTVLVCTPRIEGAPGFALLYLNASQNCVHILTLPAETAVPFGGGDATLADAYATLADAYAAAGPARCREALLEPLALPEETRYLALSASVLSAVADRYGMLRVGFSGALTADDLAACGAAGAVQSLSVREAQAFLSALPGSIPPQRQAAARAAVWDAFFRQDLELLPTTLPAALRANSSALLTDLSAQDLLILEETLEFLANNAASVFSDALPGEWDAAAGRYALTDASRAAMQSFFNVSPTAGQASSASEP